MTGNTNYVPSEVLVPILAKIVLHILEVLEFSCGMITPINAIKLMYHRPRGCLPSLGTCICSVVVSYSGTVMQYRGCIPSHRGIVRFVLTESAECMAMIAQSVPSRQSSIELVAMLGLPSKDLTMRIEYMCTSRRRDIGIGTAPPGRTAHVSG